MSRFLADFLFLLAAWTLAIKYIFPVAYALSEGVPVLTYVMWDFWHTNWFINKCFVLGCFILLLGYLLWSRGSARTGTYAGSPAHRTQD